MNPSIRRRVPERRTRLWAPPKAVARGAGFTLVEVLLATFVIAIGVVGILALFAGAAAQQQSASLVTQSVISTNNAQAMVLRSFGRIDAGTPASLNNLVAGVWYGLPMHPTRHYLTLNPRNDANGLYFLVEAPDTPRTLYTVSDPIAAAGQAGFTNGPIGIFSLMSDLGQRRIDPATLALTVVTDNAVTPSPSTLTYSRLPIQVLDPVSAGGRYGYYRNPGAPDPLDYILVDVQESIDGTLPASIHAMQIADITSDPTRHIVSVTATGFQWRNDQLVSLENRLTFRPDETAPGGRRPELGYSLLYRRTATSAQLAAFTYRLIAPSAAAEWVPPERLQQDFQPTPPRSPLRTAVVNLGYDSVEKRYFFELPSSGADALDQWAIEPGQVLLVEGREAQSSPPQPWELGSDLPVTVSNKTFVSSFWRGYLDHVPRASGVSMLTPDRREIGTKQRLTVWGVADVVESLAPDQSLWRLQPLNARIMQVPNP